MYRGGEALVGAGEKQARGDREGDGREKKGKTARKRKQETGQEGEFRRPRERTREWEGH
jgi:hypothetical protein